MSTYRVELDNLLKIIKSQGKARDKANSMTNYQDALTYYREYVNSHKNNSRKIVDELLREVDNTAEKIITRVPESAAKEDYLSELEKVRDRVSNRQPRRTGLVSNEEKEAELIATLKKYQKDLSDPEVKKKAGESFKSRTAASGGAGLTTAGTAFAIDYYETETYKDLPGVTETTTETKTETEYDFIDTDTGTNQAELESAREFQTANAGNNAERDDYSGGGDGLPEDEGPVNQISTTETEFDVVSVDELIAALWLAGILLAILLITSFISSVFLDRQARGSAAKKVGEQKELDLLKGKISNLDEILNNLEDLKVIDDYLDKLKENMNDKFKEYDIDFIIDKITGKKTETTTSELDKKLAEKKETPSEQDLAGMLNPEAMAKIAEANKAESPKALAI